MAKLNKTDALYTFKITGKDGKEGMIQIVGNKSDRFSMELKLQDAGIEYTVNEYGTRLITDINEAFDDALFYFENM